MKVDVFWLLFVGVCGTLIGAVFHQKTQDILLLLCEILYHRAWLCFGSVVIIAATYYGMMYFIKRREIEFETILSDQKYNEIKTTVEHDLAAKTRNIDRLTRNLQNQRQRLQRASGNVYQEADKIQGDSLSFIHFVEQVQDLVGKRSEKLQSELPEQPVKIEKIIKRDNKLQKELQLILDELGQVFPDLAKTIPRPQTMTERGSVEFLQLEKGKSNSQRITEYKRKKISKV